MRATVFFERFGTGFIPALLASSLTCATATAEQVVLCHAPPGNPENVLEITVSTDAAPGHIGHGDTPPPCPTGTGSETGATPGANAPVAAFVVCDTRAAETGRDVGVNPGGRIHSGMFPCE